MSKLLGFGALGLGQLRCALCVLAPAFGKVRGSRALSTLRPLINLLSKPTSKTSKYRMQLPYALILELYQSLEKASRRSSM